MAGYYIHASIGIDDRISLLPRDVRFRAKSKSSILNLLRLYPLPLQLDGNSSGITLQ